MERILVTGAAGYVGSVLVRQLLRGGYGVRGVDTLYFGGESLAELADHARFELICGDVRDTALMDDALKDIDAVIHLAAIVGDPACRAQPDLAREVNGEASERLFQRCAEVGHVSRFLFASTCSNYGKMEDEVFVREDSPLRPVSLYADLKVNFEKRLLEYGRRRHFHPTALRFSTVYGFSPRMRFDLTVNEFVRDAVYQKELEIYGEQFWRPYCHVDDIARACVLVLESPPGMVGYDVFNVGDTDQNYQKKTIAEEIKKVVRGVDIHYVRREEDPRDYRVDFSKIKKTLGFGITKTLPQGIRQVYKILKDGVIADPFAKQYRNL